MTNKTPLLNPEVIANLRELGDPGKDFYAETAQVYLKQAAAKVKELDTQLQARNFGSIAAAALQLKSSSGNLGATGLAELFLRIEEAAKMKDVENLLRLLPALRSVFAEVKAELEQISSGNVKKAA